jgi:two-component system sensor histidine kinase UhpB
MKVSTRILLVEDNLGDQFFCTEMLVEAGYSLKNIVCSNKFSEASAAVERDSFDIVLLDLFLPDSSGIDTFKRFMELNSSPAVIVLSGLTDDAIALQAVQLGAQDFLIKGEYNAHLIQKSITYSLERKKYMSLLEQSRRQYQDLFSENPLPILLISLADLNIVTVNKGAQELYQYDSSELIGMNVGNISDCQMDDILHLDNKGALVKEHLKKSGDTFIAKTHIRKLMLENKEHFLMMVEDITDQVMFERQKGELSSNIQHFERRKIAMELHDGIAQDLTLINLYLNQLEVQLPDSELVKNSKSTTNEVISQVRSISYSMNPPMLNEGLINGLYAYFRRITRVCEVNFMAELNDDNLSIDYETSYDIFRIVQEFVNNSLKHSQTEVLHCRIILIDNKVCFELADEGIGFDMEKIQSSGLGLLNMAERAALRNMTYDFTSEPNKGTELKLILEH